jgi:uncharacterized metal-binding protein YceD (DUF177 family)
MDNTLKLYIARLQVQEEEEIKEILSPKFLEIEETDLSFNTPVYIQGKAYITGDHLIIQLNIKTKATLPCNICNKSTDIILELNNFYYTESLETIKKGVFDYQKPIREAIILEVPQFIECNNGNCIERKNIDNYIVKEKITTKENDTRLPFSNIDEII